MKPAIINQDLQDQHYILKARNLSKRFGKKEAVQDIEFHASPGEIVGILGANGAGKTTTIHMLLGLTRPSTGKISIFGMDLERNRSRILERVNFASSYTALPYNLSVKENLQIFARIYGIRNARDRITELLNLFEILPLANQRSGMLSSGEQTRLNLCKALLNEPKLLILDEPTASLDPDLADKVRKVLAQYSRESGATIITSSHNMLDVTELCHRIIFMSSGRIIAEGSSDEILQEYGSDSLEDVFIKIARNNRTEIAKVS